MGSRSGRFEPLPWDSAIEWRRIIESPFCPLPPVTRLVLTTLSRYGDKWGTDIYPSQRELAYRANVTPKTVNKALQLAEHDGWIIRKPKDRPNGRGYVSHTYELTVPGFIADFAVGKNRFWEPPYREKMVKDGENVHVVPRYP